MFRPQQSVDVLLSLRFNATGPKKEAEQVKRALVERRINAVIINTEAGENVEIEVANALSECKLAILFANEDYGEVTNCTYSTYGELGYILDHKKPFILIKMCQTYASSVTRLRLPSSISSIFWAPGMPIPPDLTHRILEKYHAITGLASTFVRGLPDHAPPQIQPSSQSKEPSKSSSEPSPSVSTGPVRSKSSCAESGESRSSITSERTRSQCDESQEDQTLKMATRMMKETSISSASPSSTTNAIAANLDMRCKEYFTNEDTKSVPSTNLKGPERGGSASSISTPRTTSSTVPSSPASASSPFSTMNDRPDLNKAKATAFSR